MNTIPTASHYSLELDLDTKNQCLVGVAELLVACPLQAKTVGLHAHKLSIKRVLVDEVETTFTLRPIIAEGLPDSVLGKEEPGHGLAATVADHSFFQYERMLQREAEPELAISLPSPPERPGSQEPGPKPQTDQDPSKGSGDRSGSKDRERGTQETSVGTAGRVAEQGGTGPSQSTPRVKGAGLGPSRHQPSDPHGDPGRASGTPSCPPSVPSLTPLKTGMRQVRIRVEYIASAEGGSLRFWNGFAITDNQVRRARGWFPCVDTHASACTFDIAVTVQPDEVAVAPGALISQTLRDGGRRKTYRYSLAQRAPPSQIALAAGPFAIMAGEPPQRIVLGSPDSVAEPTADASRPPDADQSGPLITHFGPPGDEARMQNTLAFMPLAFGLYEGFLGSRYPYASFHQVFVPGELAPESPILGAGLQILSRDILFDDTIIDQAMESWLVLARALAQMWFGMFLRMRAPTDAWLLEGLVGHLEGIFIRTFLGRNELFFRRMKEREAVALTDDGQAAPLYPKGPSYGGGVLHGTDALDPSPLRRWKATAVISMLEKKCGEDTFKKLLERLVMNGINGEARGEDQGDGSHGTLATQKFLVEVGKAAGFKKEVEAFHERWIAGRGCPQITAAFVYHKKGSSLEVALQQSANEAAKRATERALAAASKDGSSVGIIKVGIKEADGPLVEHPVNVAAQRFVLTEVSIKSKMGKPRTKGRRKKKGQADEDADEDDDGEELLDDPGAPRLPVQWVILDPQGESLALARVLQPENMWAAQLERSRDVVQQSAAVAGLVALSPTTYGVVNSLRACLCNRHVFPKVRVEAAFALGDTASERTEFAGVDILVKVYRSRILDSSTQWPNPIRSSFIGEYLIDEALPMAIARARTSSGVSPADAVDVLLEVAERWDTNHEAVDAGSALAALVHALGSLHPPTLEVLGRVIAQLERYLRRDGAVPSFQHAITRAALTSLTRLITSLRSAPLMSTWMLTMLEMYKTRKVYHKVRRTAAACTAQILAVSQGFDAALTQMLRDISRESSLTVRCGILEDFLGGMNEWSSIKPPLSITAQCLRSAHALLAEQASPRLRHLAFMLLARLGGLAPTLFREREDDEMPGLAYGPGMSMDTMTRRQRPAASGLSLESGGSKRRREGGPVVRLKATISMRPSVSAATNLSPTPPMSEDISSEGKAAATEVVSGVRNTRLRSGHLPPQRVWDFDDDSPPETPTRPSVLNAAGMRTRRSALMEESLRPTASSLSGAVSGLSSPAAVPAAVHMRRSPVPSFTASQPSVSPMPPPRPITLKSEPEARISPSHSVPQVPPFDPGEAPAAPRPIVSKTIKLKLPSSKSVSISETPERPAAPGELAQAERPRGPRLTISLGGAGPRRSPPGVPPQGAVTHKITRPPVGPASQPPAEFPPPRPSLKIMVPSAARLSAQGPAERPGLPAAPAAAAQPSAPPLETRPSAALREKAELALRGDEKERERGALLLDVMQIAKAGIDPSGPGPRRKLKVKAPKGPAAPLPPSPHPFVAPAGAPGAPPASAPPSGPPPQYPPGPLAPAAGSIGAAPARPSLKIKLKALSAADGAPSGAVKPAEGGGLPPHPRLAVPPSGKLGPMEPSPFAEIARGPSGPAVPPQSSVGACR
eukprot:jgi/Botrbrau1/11006/Bobra.101_1s0004.1